MPTSFIISLAKKSNKSIEEVESIWHKSKEIAKEKFKDENDDYWKFVTYLTKRQCNVIATRFTFLVISHSIFQPINAL